MKKFCFIEFIALLALLLTACPAMDDKKDEKTIVDLAKETANLSTLVSALEKANLVSVLDGKEAFTVFAPSNTAFESVGTKEEVLALENLADILQYHVVSGAAKEAADLEASQEFTTLQGDKITVTLDTLQEIQCTGNCAAIWPPYLQNGDLIAGEGINQALISTVERSDPSGTQITYNYLPLYTYVNDTETDKTKGLKWFLISPDGSQIDAEF